MIEYVFLYCRKTNRVVGFEVETESRSVAEYVVDESSGGCSRKAELKDTQGQGLEINPAGMCW